LNAVLDFVKRHCNQLIPFFYSFPGHSQNCAPIVQALLSKGRPVLCISSYQEERRLSESGQLLSVGGIPSSLLSFLKVPLLVTPVSGFARSLAPRGAKVLHPLHSLVSLDGVYGEGDFDGTDLCAGEHHIESFRELAARRPQLAGKTLLPLGYPKLDLALEERRALPHPGNGKTTASWVVYAPTYVYPINQPLTTLRNYGESIIDALIARGRAVMFRPHPLNLVDENKDVIQRICDKYAANPRFRLDSSKSYVESFSQCSLMVTDVSGTGFTFAFTFARPAIFFAPNPEAERGMRGIQFEARGRLGGVVRTVSELVQRVDTLLAEPDHVSEDIVAFRDQAIFNVGSSGERIAESIELILKGETDKTWILL
jgi:hypothetical protein